jgi:hypothetical protein
MDRHRIRLRKPWRHEATAQGVVWRRRFGRPGRLGDADTVWLCVEGMSLEGVITLNGEFLGSLPTPGPIARYDVTRRLLDRNELSLLAGKSHGIDDAAVPPGEALLEIWSPDELIPLKNGDEP